MTLIRIWCLIRMQIKRISNRLSITNLTKNKSNNNSSKTWNSRRPIGKIIIIWRTALRADITQNYFVPPRLEAASSTHISPLAQMKPAISSTVTRVRLKKVEESPAILQGMFRRTNTYFTCTKANHLVITTAINCWWWPSSLRRSVRYVFAVWQISPNSPAYQVTIGYPKLITWGSRNWIWLILNGSKTV